MSMSTSSVRAEYRPSERRRRLGAMAFAGVMLCASTACRERPPAPAATEHLTLRISSSLGPLSEPMATEYERRLPGISIQQERSTDSYQLVRGLETGTVDIGVGLADIAFAAYSAKVGSEGDSAIRGVSLLQPLSTHVLVRPNSGIQHFSDLNGRRVGMGPQGSSSWTLGLRLFEAFDIKADIVPMSTRPQASDAIKRGEVDAIFLPGYTYPDEVIYSAIEQGAYLIPIDGPGVDILRWQSPFVRVASIPRNIYPGQNKIIPTVGIDMVVLCRRDLPEELVYRITAELFNAFPELARVEASLKYLNIDEAPATPIPLHPGAALYYRQRELSR